MIKKAILELKLNGVDLTGLVEDYLLCDQTGIIENKLHYKNIPEALFTLVNYKSGHLINFNQKLNVFGTMIDLSRGAAFKVSYIKELIRKKALMGVNEIWLYLEDMYDLMDYPVFGYMRGKYSKEELLSLVEYAKIFGVALIPAIQTLGHQEQFLKWFKSDAYKDQYNVLMTEDEKTYRLIETMFKVLSEIFDTKKIHVGMDEAFGMGFGKYYKKNGYKDLMAIFTTHLNVVNKMALANGFEEVLIWSDMYFRINSKTEYYYDPNINITQETIESIPSNVTLVYWDYYNYNEELIKKMILKHHEFNRKIIMATGTWIWTRLTYDKIQTDKTAVKHIQVSLDTQIDEIILTQWNDDGAYGDHLSSLLGVFELSYLANTTNDINEAVYYEITEQNYQDAINNTKINRTEMSAVGLMWDDPLLAIYMNNFIGNDYSLLLKHIKAYELLLSELNKENNTLVYHFTKANLYKLKARYELLSQYFNESVIDVDGLYLAHIEEVKQVLAIMSTIWYERNKMYGLEVIQSRFATQIIRSEEMIKIVSMYNQKLIDKIPILEEKVAVKDEQLSLKYLNIAYSTRPF